MPERGVTAGGPLIFSAHPSAAVDLFAKDVGMTGVTVGFVQHMHDDIEKGCVWSRPPIDMPARVQVEKLNRFVCVATYALKSFDDSFTRLVFVDSPIVKIFRKKNGWFHILERATEDLSQVDGFPCGEVVNQSEEVDACRGERSSLVVLAESIKFGKDSGPCIFQFVLQGRFHDLKHLAPFQSNPGPWTVRVVLTSTTVEHPHAAGDRFESPGFGDPKRSCLSPDALPPNAGLMTPHPLRKPVRGDPFANGRLPR